MYEILGQDRRKRNADSFVLKMLDWHKNPSHKWNYMKNLILAI